MEKTKTKLLRVLDILRETDEEHPYTANQIIQQLALYGIEAERKSVLRDIATLQDYGYDILLHADNKRGYYLASREFEDWELKILMDAALGASFLTAENSESLAKKISTLSSKDGQKTLRTVTPVASTVKNGDPSTKIAVDLLLQAIRKKKQVGFLYIYTGDDLEKHFRFDGREYPVSPYALIWRQDKYYLIGSYGSYNKLSYYRLDRIRSLRLLDETVVPMEEFLGANASQQLREFVERNIYNYGGKTIRLRLSVDADMVDVLVDSFGNNFSVISRNEKKVIVTVSVSDGWGLNTWLLQHGDCVQILEPQSIREQVIGLLDTIRDNYNKLFETTQA